MKYSLFIGFSIFFLVSCKNPDSDGNETKIKEPLQLTYTVTNTYPHNPESFIEGLEYRDSFLYEGTGDPSHVGVSKLAKIDLKTGTDIQTVKLAKEYFGEGITILNGKIYQMTYQENKCFQYDAKTFAKLKEFTYDGEGWGLTNNGKQLIMSNGTCNITFRDPETFAVTKSICVNNQYGPLPANAQGSINELEYVDGFLYANTWMTFKIIKIDLASGNVVAEANFDDLLSKYAPEILNMNVDKGLNGIAYDSTGKRFFITGKYYPKIFEVKFN